MTNRDYYCSMKFKFLKIDLPSKTIYNCHAAAPHRIDFDWLEENPGNLFNTPVNVYEREQMLRNERNKSCEQNCWIAEDAGAVSPRINQNGIEQTHTDPVTDPEIIDLGSLDIGSGSGSAGNGGKRSANFGGGLELLMNDKFKSGNNDKSGSTNINLDDITSLEDDLREMDTSSSSRTRASRRGPASCTRTPS